ncbi:MAG TPA: GNAT family protein [Bacillota bacterium]|nr:GNAT family protein [Bacillota bacterium]
MLEGQRTRLRALEKSDIDNFMTWVNNREITQYLLALSVPVSRAFEEKWLDNAVYHTATDKVFAIETLDGEYLGNCGLHSIDSISRHAELGIVIGNTKYLSRGYGTDAIQTLLRLAFDSLNLEKVYLRVYGNNTRGIRCYEKCGFETVGRLKRHRFVNGQWQDEVLMEVFRG